MKYSVLKSPLTGLLVICLMLGALVAVAADPQPVQPEKSGKADPASDAETRTGRSSVADLDVNRAELEANGEMGLDVNAAQPALKPMTLEINAVLEQARVQVSTLQESFDKEPNAEAALVIVRQMEQIKINAELDVLRVQLRHAQLDGNAELAQKIESSLTEMTTPRPRKQPIDRPAPDAGNR